MADLNRFIERHESSKEIKVRAKNVGCSFVSTFLFMLVAALSAVYSLINK